MKTLTLRKDFFTTFVYVSIFCLRNIRVMTRTRNKIVEIIAASECYLIINPPKKIRNGKTSLTLITDNC